MGEKSRRSDNKNKKETVLREGQKIAAVVQATRTYRKTLYDAAFY